MFMRIPYCCFCPSWIWIRESIAWTGTVWWFQCSCKGENIWNIWFLSVKRFYTRIFIGKYRWYIICFRFELLLHWELLVGLYFKIWYCLYNINSLFLWLFFIRLLQRTSSFHKMFLLGSFLLISSTNNSLATDSIALSVLTLCCYCLPPMKISWIE